MRVMKNSDDAIEKVLAGLRDAERPDGMERRILRALEETATQESEWSWSRLRLMWLERALMTRVLVCATAMAGLVVVLAIPALRRAGRAPVASMPAESKIDSPPSAELPRVVLKSEGETASVLQASGTGVGVVRIPGVRVATRPDNGEENSERGGDSLAVSEMVAPSHPAPPMPLTEQERLLLRIVHKDDPVEMAVLNPVLRAARDAEDKAEFQRFFEVPERPAADVPKPEEPVTRQPVTEQSAPEQPRLEQSTSERR
jgi:hypothetical protein